MVENRVSSISFSALRTDCTDKCGLLKGLSVRISEIRAIRVQEVCSTKTKKDKTT